MTNPLRYLVYNLWFTLFITLMGSMSYALCHYVMGYGGDNIPKIVNISLVFIIFVSNLLCFILTNTISLKVPFIFFTFLLLHTILVSIFNNTPIQYTPSFLRFSTYLLLGFNCYTLTSRYGDQYIRTSIESFLPLAVLIVLTFGFTEIIIGDTVYLNSSYRLSGSFKGHSLASSMYNLVLLILLLSYADRYKRKIYIYPAVIIIAYLLIRTDTRTVIGICVIILLLYNVWMQEYLYVGKIVKVFLLLIVFLYIFNQLGLYLRFTNTVNNESLDYSINTRIDIVNNSISNMSISEMIFGIGLGGFDEYYKSITNNDNYAAHNNYLLFYVEGGIIGLVLYVLYIVVTGGLFIIYLRKYRHDKLISTAGIIFISIEVCCFLLNNYYFFPSEIFVWLFTGASLGKIHYIKRKKIDENFDVSSK